MRVLNAMHRPENLFNAVKNDPVAGFFARMICGKTAVITWVPVFCRNNQIESLLQFICNWNDFITMRHRQRAARQEIILKIDEDQRFHGCKLRATALFARLFCVCRFGAASQIRWSATCRPQRAKCSRSPAQRANGSVGELDAKWSATILVAEAGMLPACMAHAARAQRRIVDR